MTKRMLLIALFGTTTALAAPDDIKVCEAIPGGDVESATGIKIAKTHPGYRDCKWFAANPATYAEAKAFKRAAHKVSGNEYAAQMKTVGFTTAITDDTPELWCAKMVAPANMAGTQIVECRALTKGHYFEVKLIGKDGTREKAKALVSKMAARLP